MCNNFPPGAVNKGMYETTVGENFREGLENA